MIIYHTRGNAVTGPGLTIPYFSGGVYIPAGGGGTPQPPPQPPGTTKPKYFRTQIDYRKTKRRHGRRVS